MEPPKGVGASLWQFLLFLPYFIGLLFLGIIKGIILCPLVCLIVTIGNSAVILSLLPVHIVWTFYSILSAKQLGPILKLFLCLCLPAAIMLWFVLAILGSVLGGALYGFLSPIFATFDAVGEGKSYPLFHCFYDGTWSSLVRSFTVVRDFKDVCFHSYFSLMDELKQSCPDRKYYEIRLLQLPSALVASALGILVDLPVVTLVALYKSPYMLFKGWHRLFQDLIGREGPFLETMCVPIAGLAILLWPLAVTGAVLGSVLSSIFLGAYAGVVSYQESSFYYGLCFVVASVSIYDEYSNDILDMPEGSCFPRPKYRTNEEEGTVFSGRIPRLGSVRNTSSSTKAGSVRGAMLDIKPLDLLDSLFEECRRYGEVLAAKGLINPTDIEEARSSKGSQVISVGLPAYGLLHEILRSVKANSVGLLLGDGVTEITTKNRPKDVFFDWFLHPFLILKEQMKATNLSEEEEEYLGRLVLLFGDSERLKSSNASSALPLTERKRAELDAFARRIQGLTKTVSRYPTFRRHFVELVKKLSEDLDTKREGSVKDDSITEPPAPVMIFARIFSQRSFRRKGSIKGSSNQESQKGVSRNVDIV